MEADRRGMAKRQAVVIETNEVPLRVISEVAERGRAPFLGRLLDAGHVFTTEIRESLPDEPYPSQSWASLHMGVPFEDHQVWWYGDPKPEAHPQYWQVAADSGSTVGLMNVLHTSPVAERCIGDAYSFVIPDVFSGNEETIPSKFEPFHRATINLTKANSRKTSLSASAGDALGLVRTLPSLGLRRQTAAEVARLITEVGLGRIPRERLRVGQFLLARDLFLRLLREESPDLAVFFTNHVAANMHRYWYAMYPEDFAGGEYSEEWIERHRDEIPHAVEVLDRFLADVDRWCQANDRTLVMTSSMGQGPSQRLDVSRVRTAVVEDVPQFLEQFELPRDVEVLGAMNPQLSLRAADDAGAVRLERSLLDVEVEAMLWDVDRRGDVVTLSYAFEPDEAGTVLLRGRRAQARDLGLRVHDVDDHSSGRHINEGILAVSNSPTMAGPIGAVDYLEVAPAILRLLGCAPQAAHMTPTFEL